MEPIHVKREEDPGFFEWWVNPISNGSPIADPQDLKETKAYVEKTYTPETIEEIQIKVRENRES